MKRDEYSAVSALERVRAGDSGAFAEIWTEYHPVLTHYVERRARHLDAQDIASTVLESTLSATLNGKGPRRSIWAYLVRSARCEIARQTRGEVMRRPLPEESDSIAVADDRPEDAAMLQRVIASFPVTDQRLIVDLLANGAKPRELADDLGRDAAWISRRAYKLRPRLQERWIQAHVNTERAQSECAQALRHTGAVLAGNASAGASKDFWRHVRRCRYCQPIVNSARLDSRRLGSILPAVAVTGILASKAVAGPGAVADPAVWLAPDPGGAQHVTEWSSADQASGAARHGISASVPAPVAWAGALAAAGLIAASALTVTSFGTTVHSHDDGHAMTQAVVLPDTGGVGGLYRDPAATWSVTQRPAVGSRPGIALGWDSVRRWASPVASDSAGSGAAAAAPNSGAGGTAPAPSGGAKPAAASHAPADGTPAREPKPSAGKKPAATSPAKDKPTAAPSSRPTTPPSPQPTTAPTGATPTDPGTSGAETPGPDVLVDIGGPCYTEIVDGGSVQTCF